MSKLLITVLVCLPALFHSRQATVFRGGSAVQSPPSIRQALSALPNGAQLESRPVVVTVSAGSRYLDRRRLLRVKSTSSIADVRASLREQFPGLPPVKLQRLYLGSKLLADEDVISELTDLSPVPLSLDLLTGTGIYNRTVLSVADALEMLTALEVHSTANSELQRQLRGGVTDIDQSDSPRIERLELLFREQNNSLYKTWAADIQRAQTAERNPEKDAVDTAGWRRSSNKEPPMRWGILNVLDMNAEEARSALVATLLLSVSHSYNYLTFLDELV